ncbi:MAG TPA: hypothetical protein VJR89_01505, partial [Polyangiales bacterium]|nr:hypothetical protein [Polyangiales bacterium]
LTSEPGRSFRPVVLNHTRGGRVMLAGIALLALAPNRPPFVHPTRLASGIARVLVDSGDSSLLERSE